MKFPNAGGYSQLMKQTEYSTWTPVISASSGTVTSYSTTTAAYQKLGPFARFYLDFTISNIGTAAGFIAATLPSAAPPISDYTFVGREANVVGQMLHGITAFGTSIVIFRYDGAFVGGNNYRYLVSGFYKTNA